MKKIEGSEKAEQVIGRWQSDDLAVIESFDLKGDQDAGGSLTGWTFKNALRVPENRKVNLDLERFERWPPGFRKEG